MGLGRIFVSSVFGRTLDAPERVGDTARLLSLEALLTEEKVAQAAKFIELVKRMG